MAQMNISTWGIKQQALTISIIIGLMVGGWLSYLGLQRGEDPQFEVPAMSIIIPWQGAKASDVQLSVIDPLEQSLQALEDVDYIRSFSRQGYGGMIISLQGGISEQVLQQRWTQVRKLVSDTQRSFPAEVSPPIINDKFSIIYSRMYVITGADYNQRALAQYARMVQKELQQVTGVTQVEVLGAQPEAVFVEFSSSYLSSLGLSPLDIYTALQVNNQVSPTGSISTQQDQIFIRVNSQYQSIDDIERTSITTRNGVMQIGQIAHVTHGYQSPPDLIVRHQQHAAVVIAVAIEHQQNILHFGKHVDALLAQTKQRLPAGVDLALVTDQPTVVSRSIGMFERSFIEALSIVMLATLLFLGWRAGIVVALSIPLVLASVAVIMYMMDWSLNRVSLGALIIALGLMVDDAIIAVEMMLTRLDMGWSRLRAAGHAFTTTATPMLIGTCITIAGFMPVGFAKSNAGEYASAIFWIVGCALLMSWIVAIWFTPFIGYYVLAKPSRVEGAATIDIYQTTFYKRLRQFITTVIAHKFIVLISAVILLMLAGWAARYIPQQFFPPSTRLEMLATITLRQGASIEATAQEVAKLEHLLHTDPNVAHMTSFIGRSSPRFFLSLPPDLPNKTQGQLLIVANDAQAVEPLYNRVSELLADTRYFSNSMGNVAKLDFGPPVGAPVSFRVLADTPQQARLYGVKLQQAMQQSGVVNNVQLDWNEQVKTLDVQVNRQQAALFGINVSDIGKSIQTVMNGLPSGLLNDTDQTLPIMLQATAAERNSVNALDGVMMSSPTTGAAVRLSSVAHMVPSFEEGTIWRQDRKIMMTVSAEPVAGVLAVEASKQLEQSIVEPLRKQLPAGISIKAGGAIYESQRSNQAIMAVVPTMLIIITLLIIWQVRKFSVMLVVVCTAPLAMIGVVPAMLITQSPFGFIALIGVIALSGMIMRNTLILVDQIRQNLDGNMPFKDAIIEASVRRSRPVLLTAITAIVAMIPLSFSVFWGPMSVAIMGGLFVATLFTIVVEPALYAWIVKQEDQSAQ